MSPRPVFGAAANVVPEPTATLSAAPPWLIQHAPGIGALVFGTLGALPPGADLVTGPMAGAAGATFGKTLQNAWYAQHGQGQGAGRDILSNLTTGASEGIKQRIGGVLGAEAAGPLVRGAQKLAGPLMAGVARTTPDIAQTLLKEGVAITQAGRRKIMALIGDTGAQELAAARAAMTGPAPPITTPDVIARPMLEKVAQEQAGQKLSGAQLDAAVQQLPPQVHAAAADMARTRIGSLLDRRSFGLIQNDAQNLTPVQLVQLRQAADRAARGEFRAVAAGQPVAMEPDEARAIGEGARRVLATRFPEVAQHAERNAALIRAKNAIWPAAGRDIGGAAQSVATMASRAPWAGTVFGRGLIGALPGGVETVMGHTALGLPMMAAGVAGAGAVSAFDNPAMMSKLALALQSPALADALRRAGMTLGNTASHVPALMETNR